jgi:hypothetical protein
MPQGPNGAPSISNGPAGGTTQSPGYNPAFGQPNAPGQPSQPGITLAGGVSTTPEEQAANEPNPVDQFLQGVGNLFTPQPAEARGQQNSGLVPPPPPYVPSMPELTAPAQIQSIGKGLKVLSHGADLSADNLVGQSLQELQAQAPTLDNKSFLHRMNDALDFVGKAVDAAYQPIVDKAMENFQTAKEVTAHMQDMANQQANQIESAGNQTPYAGAQAEAGEIVKNTEDARTKALGPFANAPRSPFIFLHPAESLGQMSRPLREAGEAASLAPQIYAQHQAEINSRLAVAAEARQALADMNAAKKDAVTTAYGVLNSRELAKGALQEKALMAFAHALANAKQMTEAQQNQAKIDIADAQQKAQSKYLDFMAENGKTVTSIRHDAQVAEADRNLLNGLFQKKMLEITSAKSNPEQAAKLMQAFAQYQNSMANLVGKGVIEGEDAQKDISARAAQLDLGNRLAVPGIANGQ